MPSIAVAALALGLFLLPVGSWHDWAEAAPLSAAVPPLPRPHPHRASPSRKASTARAAAQMEAERAAAPVEPAPAPPAAPPIVTVAPSDRAKPGSRSAGEPRRNAQAVERTAKEQPATDRPVSEPAAPADATPPPPPPSWTDAEIADAARECDELMASIGADAELQPPLRQGQCGTPAPLKVARIGSAGGVALEPSGVMNCRMVSRLHQWLETIAQPAAREALGARITKLANASAYMCRNRYNDAAAKISEHAFANALDVSAFILSDGRRVDVKTYWGPLATRDPGPAKAGAPGKPPDLATRAVTSVLAEMPPKARPMAELTRNAPQPAVVAAPPPTPSPEQRFLRRIHDAACGIFTTVLGPEANAAHHDHFHFDLQKRRSSAYCQ